MYLGDVEADEGRTSRLRLDGDFHHDLAGMLAELDADFTVESAPPAADLHVVARRFHGLAGALPLPSGLNRGRRTVVRGPATVGA